MNSPVAVITGITGQDGSYLAELLYKKGYKVYGIKRRNSTHTYGCAEHLKTWQGLEIIEGDLTDLVSLSSVVRLAKPDEFYNLAAQSHVGTSFSNPVATMEANATGTLNCLEAIRMSGYHTRFYQASTSELFGGGYGDQLLDEHTPFHPRSPYGVAKLAAYWITVNYRESYKMFASNGILFNHESERRGPNFVTRKITRGIGEIKAGRAEHLFLGNLDAYRDWGHAEDYVRGMHMMLQHNKPDDFVLATGDTHSVRQFCEIAFQYAGLGDYQRYVKVDPQFYRPAEVDVLRGCATKAKNELGWEPEISFAQLVQRMVDVDVDVAMSAA